MSKCSCKYRGDLILSGPMAISCVFFTEKSNCPVLNHWLATVQCSPTHVYCVCVRMHVLFPPISAGESCDKWCHPSVGLFYTEREQWAGLGVEAGVVNHGQPMQWQYGFSSHALGHGLRKLHPPLSPCGVLRAGGEEMYLWCEEDLLPLRDLWPALCHATVDYRAECKQQNHITPSLQLRGSTEILALTLRHSLVGKNLQTQWAFCVRDFTTTKTSLESHCCCYNKNRLATTSDQSPDE